MSNLRDRWTNSPKTAIVYIRALPHAERASMIALYARMATGDDGGQIEPWSFHTVRSTLYPNWSDMDFQFVVDAFRRPEELPARPGAL